MGGIKYFLHNLRELAFLNIPLKCATWFSYKAKLQPSEMGSCDSLNHSVVLTRLQLVCRMLSQTPPQDSSIH